MTDVIRHDRREFVAAYADPAENRS
jgi:hypothetical protein